MKLSEILRRAGKRPARKRVGRGIGSGLGKTSARGHKGAKARSGWKRRYSHEGGQMSLVRRLPKRGFSNFNFSVRYDVVNLAVLDAIFVDGATVSLEVLAEKGVLKPRHGRLKILGSGDLHKKLTIHADGISKSARLKVEQAGGKVETRLK